MRIPCVSLAVLVSLAGISHAAAGGGVRGRGQGGGNAKNVILFLVDDVGHADVSYNDGDFPTPNIDKLSGKGVRLDSMYVQSVCSPTRSAVLSGRYPFRVGNQWPQTIMPTTTQHMTTEQPTIAEFLRDEGGYATAAIGKWHLGNAHWDYTPMGRGFDSHVGLHSGMADYYNRTIYSHSFPDFVNGYSDMWRTRRGMAGKGESGKFDRVTPALQFNDLSDDGVYSQDLYLNEARQVLFHHTKNQQQRKKPLFMFYAPQAIHTPVQMPPDDDGAIARACRKIRSSTGRSTLCAMMHAMDKKLGELVGLYKEYGLWDDTVLWFVSDNGGMVEYGGFEDSFSSNWPLRGGKATLFEGGVKVPSFIIGGDNVGLPKGKVYSGLMHASDMLPTIATAVGLGQKHSRDYNYTPDGTCTGSGGEWCTDGYDQWDAIVRRPKVGQNAAHNEGPRSSVPINVYDGPGSSPGVHLFEAVASSVSQSDGLYGESSALIKVIDGSRFKVIKGSPSPLGIDGWWTNEKKMGKGGYTHIKAAESEGDVRLFNLSDDPVERHDLAGDEAYTSVLQALLGDLEALVDPNGKQPYVAPQKIDAHVRGLPQANGDAWGPFLAVLPK